MSHASEPAHSTPRSLRALTREQCRNLLRRHHIGRVVFADPRGPAALPVNYVVDRDDIVFRTEASSSVLGPPLQAR